MSVYEDNKTPLSDEELREIEREEMQSWQEINGHAYESPYDPDENETDIALRHTEDVIRECGDDKADLTQDANLIGREILTRSNNEMMERNLAIKDSKFKYPRLNKLPPAAVAKLILANPNIFIRKVRIPAVRMEAESERYIPALREGSTFSYLMKDGSNDKLNALIRWFNPNASKQYILEVYACIRDSNDIDKVEPTMDTNLVPVNNGVWDFDKWEQTHDKTKAFISNKDPEYDKYTFMTKIPIDYDPDAENPVIHNDEDGTDWDVMTWIDELFNKDGKHPLHTKFLLEVIHATVRIFTPFGMGIWFLDNVKYGKGGQGKGTFGELLRNLVGIFSCKNLEIYDLQDPKKLSGLERCNAIIADEANKHYIKNSANYKLLMRGEPVVVKTLYKDEYSATFNGILIHCMNEPLAFGDSTGSMERTRVVLTWNTSFTDPASGIKERKYIKNDYVKRPEVLRYLLKYTLEEMNITEFSKDCLEALAPNLQLVRDKTNAVAEFLNEHEEEFVWGRIPCSYLFDIFCVWYSDTHCQKPQYKLNAFIDNVALWADKSELFEFHPQSFRPCRFMGSPEPLTQKYNLGYPWVRKGALERHYERGERPLADCVPQQDKGTTYKKGGLFRKGTKGTSTYTGSDWDESVDDNPAQFQYTVSEYKDSKIKRYNVDTILIKKKLFLINDTEECITLLPFNAAGTQSGSWPVRIDRKLFDVEDTGTELCLIPYTKEVNEEYRPIREAIVSVTACDEEDSGQSQG